MQLVCDLKPMTLHCHCLNLAYMLLLCLEIDTFEHCHLLPAIREVAAYRGNCELASVCHRMMEQIAEPLDCLDVLQYAALGIQDEPDCRASSQHHRKQPATPRRARATEGSVLINPKGATATALSLSKADCRLDLQHKTALAYASREPSRHDTPGTLHLVLKL